MAPREFTRLVQGDEGVAVRDLGPAGRTGGVRRGRRPCSGGITRSLAGPHQRGRGVLKPGSRSAVAVRMPVSGPCPRAARARRRDGSRAGRITGLIQRARRRVPSAGQPSERRRKPSEHPEPHLLHEQPEQPGAGACRRARASLPVSPGGKLSKRVARDEDGPPPPDRRRSHISSWTSAPAGVIADEDDILSDRAGRGTRRTSRARPGNDRSASACHRPAMRAERKGSARHTGGRRTDPRPVPSHRDASIIHPCSSTSTGTVTAGVLVRDRPGGQLDLPLHERLLDVRALPAKRVPDGRGVTSAEDARGPRPGNDGPPVGWFRRRRRAAAARP